jgi:hypothetical protein
MANDPIGTMPAMNLLSAMIGAALGVALVFVANMDAVKHFILPAVF